MGLNDILNNIALSLENLAQLEAGEFRLGMLDLDSLSEIQPLNQKFEAILFRCKNCGKTTAFLSLKSIDHFIDVEKKSILQCRHCQFEMQIPVAQEIRAAQGKVYDFLQLESGTFTKILTKKGRLVQFSTSEAKITFESSENLEQKEFQIEVPQNKLKQLNNLQNRQLYRFKIKVYTSTVLNPQGAFIKKSGQSSETIQIQKYELLSLSKIKS